MCIRDRVLAVGHCPQLAHLRDCIVVPATGAIPLMWAMGGGDLDGDKLVMICCAALVQSCEQQAPFDHGRSKAESWESCPGLMAGGVCCCLLYTSPSPRDRTRSRMPSSA
eukprot:TRINITY_DN49287_c0_g1_i1.p1 TRINITY_DN49287_c0_g1~~TRINITY_DN49287_c0_g1_i1.p1  ORF type:complete len:110 (-),score=23.98 TRINITY_DN49287_c0_g1_i1:42-371(-)